MADPNIDDIQQSRKQLHFTRDGGLKHWWCNSAKERESCFAQCAVVMIPFIMDNNSLFYSTAALQSDLQGIPSQDERIEWTFLVQWLKRTYFFTQCVAVKYDYLTVHREGTTFMKDRKILSSESKDLLFYTVRSSNDSSQGG